MPDLAHPTRCRTSPWLASRPASGSDGSGDGVAVGTTTAGLGGTRVARATAATPTTANATRMMSGPRQRADEPGGVAGEASGAPAGPSSGASGATSAGTPAAASSCGVATGVDGSSAGADPSAVTS